MANEIISTNNGSPFEKAKIACKASGYNVLDDFANVGKIVKSGATSKKVKDYELSRYA